MLEIPATFDLVDEISYEDARYGGGTESRRLPILVGRGAVLPPGLEGLVLTSDLQGMEPLAQSSAPRPLGRLVADVLAKLSRARRLPPASQTGVVLAGDLYSVPDLSRRGVSGPVDEIWLHFACTYCWVTGVLGNHDQLERPGELETRDNIHLLDGRSVTLDGMTIAGVAGIMGRPTKLNRKTPEHFLELVRSCIAERPELLVLHQGPGIAEDRLRGSIEIRHVLEDTKPAAVVFGHCHWPEPVKSIGDTVLVNADARVIVLVRA